jgi:hypothetical protein
MGTFNSPRAGINGTATINGNELPVVSWNSAPTAVIVPFVNSLSGGHPRKLPTITDGGMFSISVDWDDANNAFTSPLSIRVGTIITNIKLYIDGSSGSRYKSIPSAIVAGTPIAVEVPGKITYSIVATVDYQWAEIGGSLS